jgi:hypothetical protein
MKGEPMSGNHDTPAGEGSESKARAHETLAEGEAQILQEKKGESASIASGKDTPARSQSSAVEISHSVQRVLDSWDMLVDWINKVEPSLGEDAIAEVGGPLLAMQEELQKLRELTKRRKPSAVIGQLKKLGSGSRGQKGSGS